MLTFNKSPWTIKPRKWQVCAMEKIFMHLTVTENMPAVVRAVPGAGKSKLIKHVCDEVHLESNEVIVISTTFERLVEQLEKDFHKKGYILEDSTKSVGCYYGKLKQTRQVIISCNPSLVRLGAELKALGFKVALWIVDECHRTENDSMKAAAAAALEPRHILGFSGTPFLSDESKALSLFKVQIYNYSAAQALADGVIVPFRVVPYMGDLRGHMLDDVCIQMIKGAEGPGVVNAETIEDAEEFANKLNQTTDYAGYEKEAEAIHSKLETTSRSASKSTVFFKTGRFWK